MSQNVKKLKPFTSCNIGAALFRLKEPNGGHVNGPALWSPMRQGTVGLGQAPTIIGEATTVRIVPAGNTSSPSLNSNQHFADNNQPGKIMFVGPSLDVSVNGRMGILRPWLRSACFNAAMGARAMQLGAAGVVVYGKISNVAELQAMGLPVFAAGTSSLGPDTLSRVSELDTPIYTGFGVWVKPGDIIVGDSDGVVVCPPSLVEQVAQICHEQQEIDGKMMEALQAGHSMQDTIVKLAVKN